MQNLSGRYFFKKNLNSSENALGHLVYGENSSESALGHLGYGENSSESARPIG